MLPALVTLEELAVRIPGGIAAADEDRAQAALEDASALIRHITSQTWVTGTVPDVVAMVAIKVARRVVENPDGVSQETLGPYSVSLANSSSDAYLTRGEQALVLEATGTPPLTSVKLTSPLPVPEPWWLDDDEDEVGS